MTIVVGVTGRLLTQSFVQSLVDTSPEDTGEGTRQSWMQTHARVVRQLGPVSAPRAILARLAAPLLHALGFDAVVDVLPSGTALVCTARTTTGSAAVVVSPWAERLDTFWRVGVQAARRGGTGWCLLFNGPEMRIVDATRLYSRRFAAFDLTAACEQPTTASVLWRVASATAICKLDGDAASLGAMVAASDGLSAAVCRSLRAGVLAASRETLSALLARDRFARTRLDDAFEQALTIVYRMLFLLFAEARSLVPIWHAVYRESYSIESLRDAAEYSDQTPGLWDALRAIARLAHAGCRAGDLTVNPFNGRLFSPAHTPLAERRGLDDAAARRAVLALSSRSTADRAARERIAYRDLGVEELGAVYETLLDYQPRATLPPKGRRSRSPVVTLEPESGVRKATGTFYTPQAIAEYLVRTTLAPLVRDATPEAILELRVLDMAMGSGAFLVAACRYLAAAYEQSTILSGACRPHDIADTDRAVFRRNVAERCLYGVDVNPMAVQLARLSLWLTTLSAGRPLSFLDHRLVSGDSLLGTWLTHLRRPPTAARRSRPGPLPLFEGRLADNALQSALPLRFSLEAMPDDTLEEARAKELAFAGLARDSHLALWKRIANLWVSSWFDGEPRLLACVFQSLSDDVLAGVRTLNASSVERFLHRSDEVAGTHRFFHWELEFPEVFFDRNGRRLARPGFDAVIGNPPWDMVRADQGDAGTRARARRTAASTIRFTRDSGVYAAQSAGHANRYQLFLERTLDLTRPGGRFGLVLPSGLATDHGSTALRRMLLSRSDVDAIVGLDNHRRIFPIHRSVRFLLLTATAGAPTSHLRCQFGIDSLSGLETLSVDHDQRAFPVQLSTDALGRLSGDALAIPNLRSRMDVVIAERAASLFLPLGHAAGWGVRFGRELNATEDRDAFRAGPLGIPVVDGRHISPFQVDTTRVGRRIGVTEVARRLDVARIGRARLGYRDVASATNRVTLIAAVLPPGCACTHTVFTLRDARSSADQHLLCGLFNSLTVNYLARLRVSTHVTTAIVEWLPLPTRQAAPALCRTIAALARRLSRRHSIDDWARLNASVAQLYQLTADEFVHVLDTFPLIDRSDRDAALEQFKKGVRGVIKDAD